MISIHSQEPCFRVPEDKPASYKPVASDDGVHHHPSPYSPYSPQWESAGNGAVTPIALMRVGLLATITTISPTTVCLRCLTTLPGHQAPTRCTPAPAIHMDERCKVGERRNA
jgi:hypothetical protein